MKKTITLALLITLLACSYLSGQERTGNIFEIGTKREVSIVIKKLVLSQALDAEIEKRTPLMWAARAGNDVTVSLLIEAGANVQAKNEVGNTALQYACYTRIIGDQKQEKWRGPRTARLLLSAGANPNARNTNGWEPILDACQSGDIQLVRLLLNAGAKVNARSKNRSTPLLMAAKYSNDPDVIDLLLKSGAKTKYKLQNGDSALALASKYQEKLEILKLLVDAGISLNARNKEGYSPLMYAARHNTFPVVKYLVKAGCSLSQKTNNGWSPLMLAAISKDPSKTSLLLGSTYILCKTCKGVGDTHVRCTACGNNGKCQRCGGQGKTGSLAYRHAFTSGVGENYNTSIGVFAKYHGLCWGPRPVAEDFPPCYCGGGRLFPDTECGSCKGSGECHSCGGDQDIGKRCTSCDGEGKIKKSSHLE